MGVVLLVGLGESLCAQADAPGGAATVDDAGVNAFGFAPAGLDAEQRRAFAVGNSFFKENWVTAPASTSGRDGLGPLFNARSCSGCHLRDGRSQPPEADDADRSGLLLRLGVPQAGRSDQPDPRYGGQLQDAAILGVRAEGRVAIEYASVPGEYGDGTRFELLAPTYRVEQLAYGPLGERCVLGARVAPQLVGLGLLEAVPAEDAASAADPEDRDGDGISGRAAWLDDGRLGRFGWKATQATVHDQVAAAFVNDIGITSRAFAEEGLTAEQAARIDAPSGGRPEIEDEKLERVSFYCRVLAVPARRGAGEPEVLRGEALFAAAGCAACHVPAQRTGAAVLPALADQDIRPYTDLLLHDMGAGLADGKADGAASGSEWRTPPLWGLGLLPVVSGHTRLLHDGRARDVDEAILWHGGEAAAAREAFRVMPRADREALLAFVRSL